MQVRLRDFYAVELALQHGANHNIYTLSFILAKQALVACFGNSQAVLPDF
ncbi:hypothetical protein LVE21_004014 [Salmonella enterica]|nr:hypothetical protein [Salmonella enterica]